MTNSPTDLKPCPFCGEAVRAVSPHGRYVDFWRIVCTACNYEIFRYHDITRMEIAAWWNNRVAEKEAA